MDTKERDVRMLDEKGFDPDVCGWTWFLRAVHQLTVTSV
jgi:hypothetical protein